MIPKVGGEIGNTHNVDTLISGDTNLGALGTKVNTHDTHGVRLRRYVTGGEKIGKRGRNGLGGERGRGVKKRV